METKTELNIHFVLKFQTNILFIFWNMLSFMFFPNPKSINSFSKVSESQCTYDCAL